MLYFYALDWHFNPADYVDNPVALARVFFKKKRLRSRFKKKALAMTYFHMRKPHTIIGACSFHF